jgi:hypothetical protein
LKKCANGPFLYDTKSPDYRDQHMRANAWEEIGKDLSSRDVRIGCPRLKTILPDKTRHNSMKIGLKLYLLQQDNALLKTVRPFSKTNSRMTVVYWNPYTNTARKLSRHTEVYRRAAGLQNMLLAHR